MNLTSVPGEHVCGSDHHGELLYGCSLGDKGSPPRCYVSERCCVWFVSPRFSVPYHGTVEGRKRAPPVL